MGMGICKTNCCIDKKNTFSLQIEELKNNQTENIVSLVKEKKISMRIARKTDLDESNFTSLVIQY